MRLTILTAIALSQIKSKTGLKSYFDKGKVYLEVDRFFPSSKTCHVCLNQVKSLPLDVRQWTCSACGTIHDRDVNAAISLRDEGLRLLTSGTGGKAYCPDVRPSRGGRKKSTTRQSAG